MSWDREPVAVALVDLLGDATGVKVHPRPPETVNPMSLVVARATTVAYGIAGLSIDEATLPVIVVGGIETEDQMEALKSQARAAVLADPTLAGTVQAAYPSEERNWRNLTGGGGIQLLLVDLILTIQM